MILVNPDLPQGPSRRGRDKDPFHSQRPLSGRKARFLWWQRLGATAGLFLMVGTLGTLLAGAVGLGFLLAGLTLENIIG